LKTLIVNRDKSMKIIEIPKPRYNEKQALVKTIANGMCGSDLKLIHQEFKSFGSDKYPIILGHEGVGEVVEIGSKVKGLKAGDKVLLPFVDADKEHLGVYGSGWGALSEYGVVNEIEAWTNGQAPEVAIAQKKLPDDIDPIDAVTIVTFREVLSAVKYFGIQKEDVVVVYGSGPVALSFIRIMTLIGIKEIIVVVRSKLKSDIVKEHGATCIINSKECNVIKKVRKIYPEGVQYVLDAVGSEAIINEAMGMLCDRGEILCYGVPATEKITVNFSKADFNWKINFQQMPRKREEGEAHEQILEWIRTGRLCMKDFISDYFKFDNAVEAYEKFERKEIKKKGIIVF
jgi:L-iditol 2-dehydrogenase